MILLAILSLAAIGFLCWLLFTLAVFALPLSLSLGVSAGTWAWHTGAGWLGAILVGLVAAALTLGVGQGLLAVVRPLWAKLVLAAVFVAPAVVAGFHAVHGIVKHTMPSELWQTTFSIIGAFAIGIFCIPAGRRAGIHRFGPGRARRGASVTLVPHSWLEPTSSPVLDHR